MLPGWSYNRGAHATARVYLRRSEHSRLPLSSAGTGKAATRIPTLGVLLYSTPQQDPQAEALEEGLREIGYVNCNNILIEYRFAEGNPARLSGLANELVRLQPNVLFPLGGDVAPFVAQATKTIPIVFVMSADPLQLGLVSSIAHPGRNATGFTFLQDELASKRLDLLKEIAPATSRVAFLFNPDHPDNELQVAQRTATALGVYLQPIEMRGPGDLDAAFKETIKAKVNAFYVVASRQTVLSLPRIVNFAIQNGLPLAGGWGAWAAAGGLFSYGPNPVEVVRAAAAYIDKVLKGTKPADLPVQRPTRFELHVNVKSAKALALSIPEAFPARADKVIE